MANQFIARNGIISRGDVVISGSFISTAPAAFSGSLSITGSYLQNGATDNSGKADFAVKVGTSPMIALWNGQVNIGDSSDANYEASFFVNSTDAYLQTWTRDLILRTNTTNTSQNIRFNTADSGVVAERMRITGAGNVGIGTTSPAQRLEVNGNILLQNNNELRWKDTGAIERTIVRVNSSNELEYGWSGAGPVKFMGGGSYTERMRVHTNGNVGIGTTAPDTALHVNKAGTASAQTIVAAFSSTSTRPTILFSENANGVLSNGMSLEYDGRLTGNDNKFYINNNLNPSTPLFTVTNGGNVGIGTTSPGYKLHVDGSTQIGVDSSNTNNYLYIQADANKARYIQFKDNASRQAIGFPSGSQNLEIKSLNGGVNSGILVDYITGRINIGHTDTNSAVLHIKGEGTSYGTTALKVENANASTNIEVLDNGNINQKLAGFKSTSFGTDTSKFATGPYYTAFGNSSGLAITTGGYWTAVGASAGASTTTGQFWNAFGFFAGRLNTTGNYWNAIGANSGENNTSGSYWIALGYQAARYYSGGTTTADSFSNGVYIGATTKVGTSGAQNEIVIGHEAEGIGSNSVVLGNNSITTTALKGNVGIGTTSPSAKLHTVGTEIVNKVESSNTVSYTQYYNTSTGTGGTGNGLTVGVNGLDAYVFQREAASLILGTFDTERIRITSGGNIGIGTTTPRAKLDIQDSTHGTLMLSRPSETGYAMISGSSGLGFEFKTYNAGEVMAMKIANDGNVGIGTTNPSYTLDVSGSGRFTGGINIGNQSTSISPRLFAVSTSPSSPDSSGRNLTFFSYNINSTNTLSVGAFNFAGEIVSITSGGYNNIRASRIFSPSSGDGVYTSIHLADTINQTGGANGISRGLYISPTLTSAADFRAIETVVGNNLLNSTSGNTYIGLSTNTGTARLQVKGEGTTSSTTSFRVENANASASLVVKDDGKVGIGTTSPSRAFHVYISDNDEVARFTSVQSNDAYIEFQSNTTTTSPKFGILDNNFVFFPSGSETVRFTDTGNVGIGTTSPNAGLEISTTENSTLRLTRNDNTGNYLQLQGGTAGAIYNINTSGQQHHIFQTGGNERMRITSDGNVGIGTTTPTWKLEVAATDLPEANPSSSNPGGISIKSPNASALAALDFGFYDSGTPARNTIPQGRLAAEFTGNGTKFHFIGSGNFTTGLTATLLTITENGKLGIGTTTPSARTHIVGSGTTSSTTSLLVQNSSATPSLAVLDNGNVGIGTSAPSSSLHINTSSPVISLGAFYQYTKIYGASQSNLNTPSFGAHSIVFQSNQTDLGYGFYFRQTNGFTTARWTGGTGGTLNLTSGGFAPSGSGSGTYRHVDIAYTLNGTSGAQTGTGYGIYLDATETSLNGLTSALIDLRSNNTSRFTVLGTGNVGIGTTTPLSSLHVSGSTTIDGVLTLTPQDPLPTGVPTGSFAVSSSVPPKPYFYDGTSWNALY